jgi:hypothetical protein
MIRRQIISTGAGSRVEQRDEEAKDWEDFIREELAFSDADLLEPWRV